jgi:hypothetical protein
MLKSPQLDIAEKQAVQNIRLNAVVRYWNQRRGDNVMPSRIQIDPVDIARLLPIVFIAEIVGTDIRLRLVGSETTAAYGKDMRGRSIREIELGAFTPAWVEAFGKVAGDGAPSFASGFFMAGSQNCRIETVLLPLSDGNGNLSHIFGGAVIKPVSRDEAPLRREQKVYITRLDGNHSLQKGRQG